MIVENTDLLGIFPWIYLVGGPKPVYTEILDANTS